MSEGFWGYITRYLRYFISITLGVFLNAVAPFTPLFKRPATALPLVGLFIGIILFTVFTLRAMLGLSPI